MHRFPHKPRAVHWVSLPYVHNFGSGILGFWQRIAEAPEQVHHTPGGRFSLPELKASPRWEPSFLRNIAEWDGFVKETGQEPSLAHVSMGNLAISCPRKA